LLAKKKDFIMKKMIFILTLTSTLIAMPIYADSLIKNNLVANQKKQFATRSNQQKKRNKSMFPAAAQAQNKIAMQRRIDAIRQRRAKHMQLMKPAAQKEPSLTESIKTLIRQDDKEINVLEATLKEPTEENVAQIIDAESKADIRDELEVLLKKNLEEPKPIHQTLSSDADEKRHISNLASTLKELPPIDDNAAYRTPEKKAELREKLEIIVARQAEQVRQINQYKPRIAPAQTTPLPPIDDNAEYSTPEKKAELREKLEAILARQIRTS
jgi:hypothetical protein